MIDIREIQPTDRPWVESALVAAFGSKRMAVRGRLYEPASHEGFIAIEGARRVGLLTYIIDAGELEITALASQNEGRGVGSALMTSAVETARAAGCRRVWLITTNDNLPALRFYQKRGFHLVSIHRGAVDYSRATLKPEIPELGQHGIPIHDELELEFRA